MDVWSVRKSCRWTQMKGFLSRAFGVIPSVSVCLLIGPLVPLVPLVLISFGCTPQESDEVIQPQASTKSASDQEQKPKDPLGADQPPKSVAVTPVDLDCVAVPSIKPELPYYVASKNLVVSRFISPCTPSQGGVGLKPKSSWMAMGFPCTGGGGRVDIRGKYHNPNLVAFVIGTECPMVPALKDQVQSLLVDEVGLPKDAPLVAYLPFVVQFWEVMGHKDADTGFAIELRSASAIESLWKGFRESRDFNVRLYGRENSWVPGGHFYQVDASIIPDGRSSFKMKILGVKVLNGEETAKIKARCEGLRPNRHCAAVF